MGIYKPVSIIFLTLFVTLSPVFAHSFNVAILLRDATFLNGFMLATAERDSHADETSDGHLGGLDVYVSVVDTPENIADDADIVVLREPTQDTDNLNAVPLYLGQTPFTQSDLPSVEHFISTYKAAYGKMPTISAAQGYNAARRIDHAVRPLSGVDDRAALQRSLKNTASGFNW